VFAWGFRNPFRFTVDPVSGTPSAAANAVGPYEFLNDRILDASEFFAHYMLGYDVPWVPTAAHTDASGVPTIIYNTSLLSDIERLVHPGSDTLLYDPAYTEAHFLLPLLVLPILFFTMRALLGLNDRFLEALVALTAIPLLSNYLTEGHLLPLLPVGILLAAHAWRTHAHRLFWVLVLSVPFFADYVRLYSTVAYLSPYLAQVLFIEYAPGLAAVVVWLCALRLAARAKSIPA